MRRPSFLRKFALDRRANTAILFGLSLPVMVGMAGLGVETGYWYFKQRELQTAADVAAFAGAVEKRGGASMSGITSAARTEAIEHGFVQNPGTIEVNAPPETGSYQDTRSVEVILTMPVERFFSQLFNSEAVIMSARGVARYQDGGQACILALDPEASGAVNFTGNALTLLNGCNVMSNSLSDSSLIVTGSADVTAPCAMAAGGVSADDGLTLTDCAEPQTNVPPAADPFKNLPEPTLAGSCPGGLSLYTGNGTATMLASTSVVRVCGGGTVKGNVTFSCGAQPSCVFIMDGGTFKINAGANVVGSGVTFFLKNNATVDFNGNVHIDLKAPTSGTYKGMLFWGDDNNSAASNKFNGNASSLLTGALYFPSQDVQFLGNFSGQNGCMRVVAKTVKITGSTDMNADCAGAGLGNMALPGRVSLVE